MEKRQDALRKKVFQRHIYKKNVMIQKIAEALPPPDSFRCRHRTRGRLPPSEALRE